VTDVPVILLSGMAADERLFAPQLAAFPNLRVQPWVPPLPGESVRAYAARLAPRVDPGRPCLVGGASFGGIVALELATHLPALGCVLFGSIRSPAALPWRWRVWRPLARLGPDALGAAAAVGARVTPGGPARRLRRLARPEAAFVRWAMCAVLRWQPSAGTGRVRVYHIHGADDRVLPARLARADVVVPRGHHALPVFNAAAVNDFLGGVLREVTRCRSPDGSTSAPGSHEHGRSSGGTTPPAAVIASFTNTLSVRPVYTGIGGGADPSVSTPPAGRLTTRRPTDSGRNFR
jgi:pimeloyl-ACP methyl ester carboxylesterase